MSSEILERSRALELAREVDTAVDQLWAAGSAALVLRLLLEDCQRLLRAWHSSSEAEGGALLQLDTLCQSATSLGTPGLERELGPAHLELLEQLASTRRRCVVQLQGSSVRAKRRRRAAAAALLATVGVVGFFLFRNTATAQVSSSYGSDFPAQNVLDGLKKTEWLLPDGQTGWLELTFSRPRSVKVVRLTNSLNGQYHDRATKAFKLEAFTGARVVATAHGAFPPIAETQPTLSVPLVARDVTHIRVTIESYYRSGAGLAEVEP